MPKIDLDAIPQINATGYPEPYATEVSGRWYRRLGPGAGLTDFGVSHVTLEPGAFSSARHWHEDEDEFVVMLAGEAVLIDDHGRTPLRAGDCAAFPKNDGNGHRLANESDGPCIFVAIGKTANGTCHYSDIDMRFDGANQRYVRKDGTSY